MRRRWLVVLVVALAPVACSSSPKPLTASDPKYPKVEISKTDLRTYCAATEDALRGVQDAVALQAAVVIQRFQNDKAQLDAVTKRVAAKTKPLIQSVAAVVQSFADQAQQGTSPLTPDNLSRFNDAIGHMPGCGGV